MPTGESSSSRSAEAITAPTLLLPKKSVPSLSQEAFAELRAEFGSTTPLSTDAATPSCDDARTSHVLSDVSTRIWKPSSTLRSMMQYWTQKQQQGQILRSTDTLAVCQRHRDERDVIPLGQMYGWPMSLDLKQLRRRVTSPGNRYLRLLEDFIVYPNHSTWFQRARTRRETTGKKASASAQQLETFHERQTGYYGEQGWELFHDILTSAYIHDPMMASLDLTKPATLKKMHPLDAREFVDQVLLPELVCMLIQDDMGGEKSGITYDAAEAMQQASQKFGIAMFPSEHAPSAHTSKRGSGAWIGASPKRAKKGDTDLAAVRKPRGGLVQQTLAVRRSARTASSSSVSDTHIIALA
ncbi:hypothetical protein Malapachy_4053 [Malassezia pachydermatis]|uniref:Restriction of telomere capping protein 4 n=1 Tax=Malassezia pachydermatis TaxID=77020 RepID=A0A0M8MV20_9BASI|nr:hypothetical protein Malapachy_4053 [Malassezia pachydermatis]KOS14171.1 hypothetical protein Malapachy_4053 [Malassezia pachydermatis]